MHELSLAQDMVAMLTRVARENQARRVIAAHLRIGELAGVDPETLAFAFEVASRDTPLAGCRLEVTRVPVALRCAGCGWEGGELEGGCPACGRGGLTVLAGRELQVDTIDVDD